MSDPIVSHPDLSIMVNQYIPCDLHSHSSRSMCGNHSYMEMIGYAYDNGMKGLQITDHGPDAGVVQPMSVFFDYKRLPPVINGVRFWRGIEANFRTDATIDFVPDSYDLYDLILCGFHNTSGIHISKRGTQPEFPDLLMMANERSSFYTPIALAAISGAFGTFDVFTHPTLKGYPLEIGEVVKACATQGIAVELNNASFRYNKHDPKLSVEYIRAINCYMPPVVINSDAHTFTEVGLLEDVMNFLRINPLNPDVRIVNATLESTQKFIDQRKALRQK